MGDKGGVYYCAWEKTSDGEYVAWEKIRPKVRVTADKKNELVGLLGEVVGEYHNDLEASLHFEPDLLAGGEFDHLFVDDLVWIAWNTGFRYFESRHVAFTGGRCGECSQGLGSRSAEPLIVDSFGSGSDGATSPISNGPAAEHNTPGNLTILSEGFLNLLTTYERATFQTRPVKWSTNRRVKFFEVLPKAFVREVAISGMEVTGWFCKTCGARSFRHGKTLDWTTPVVCRADLPSPLPPLFFLGGENCYEMAMNGSRFKELVGKKSSRKICSFPIAVIEESNCERTPKLPELYEILKPR